MTKESTKKSKIIAIVGPTASGKSNFAIDYALKNNGEIISADSRLVYKGFNIATAKPTFEEMKGIKHYLIDIVEPTFDYSVANFSDDAKIAIEEIDSKGKLPIIVGGSGLYFRILLENFALPRIEANYELRKELEQKSSQQLHEILKVLDIKSSEKIHVNNKVKIIRAIEVCKFSGKPMSEAASTKDPEFEVEWIGLNFKNRENLYEKIEKRVDNMLELGIVKETEFLLQKYGRTPNFVNTIGYSEILKFLDKQISLEDAIKEIKINTRHYAKRQLTWFRRNENINWIEY